MSLLGIDVGTTGCKALVFSDTGEVLGSSYAEYAAPSTQGERAEIDPREVWMKVAACVREAAAGPGQGDPVRAVSVASLGESVVSVDRGRSVLGTSMLMNDRRGEEYLPALREKITDRELFAINGNVLGNHYSLTKLMWLRDNEPERHEGTEWYLHFSGYISHLLGAGGAVIVELVPVIPGIVRGRAVLVVGLRRQSIQVDGHRGAATLVHVSDLEAEVPVRKTYP